MPTILIIDDEDLIRELLRRILEHAGYEVLEASDGAEGLRLYEANRCELVVTDILMPEKEGIETIMELRRKDPEVKIIAISGGGTTTAGSTWLQAAKLLGANRTLAKPIDVARLRQAVRELLGT